MLEENIKQDLHRYLVAQQEVDEHLPQAPDVEEKWFELGQAYLPDGMREFGAYPNVSLGWMMYIGMAVAQMWDEDWQRYATVENLYESLRKPRGYDAMDEYIRHDVLHLKGNDYNATEKLVGECAARTYNLLRHANLEPGTREAFKAYVACLHQMYLFGAAIQLRRLGYHMTPMG